MSKTEKKKCRYCWSHDTLQSMIAPCGCTGSMKYVHPGCLSAWLLHRQESRTCEVCKSELQFTVPLSNAIKVAVLFCWVYMVVIVFGPYLFVYYKTQYSSVLNKS